MADILAAFEELDRQERKKHPKKAPKSTATKYRNPLISNNSSSEQRQGRPRSLPSQNNNSSSRSSPTKNTTLLSPSYTAQSDGHSERSPSVSSTRRISFVNNLPRPASTQHRLRIPTKSASLASGFIYDPKLNKYSVTETEWTDFSDAIIDQANLPRMATWAWPYHRKDVIKRLGSQLRYEGSDIKRHLNAWNRSFRRKGFTVSMELPGPAKINDADTEEQKRQARKEAKYFRMVVTPVAEKAGSIYSRTSSLTRSVTNEGMSLQPSKEPVEDDADVEGDGEGDADSQKAHIEEGEVLAADAGSEKEHIKEEIKEEEKE